MVKILIDTSVWLDLVKDRSQHHLIKVLEQLISEKEIELVVPEIIVAEFNRNKARIVKESGQSLSSHFKRVKDAIELFGEVDSKASVLTQLNNIDFKIPLLGESASPAIKKIEEILKKSKPFKVSTAAKVKAVDRATQKLAPFHRQKNSINDALLIESYAEFVSDKHSKASRFMFITHNKNDFSDPTDEREPHPDFRKFFSKIKSRYLTKLSEGLNKIRPDLITDAMIDSEFYLEPRTLSEILTIENELIEKIWYNRHQIRVEKIDDGVITVVDSNGSNQHSTGNQIVDHIWEGAKKSAAKVEDRYGKENLGPWDDFEWGMINGKLSAIRWVIGEEWDVLDT